MASLNLKGLTKEEKKQRLHSSIALLEEEEEDNELHELMARHEALQKRKNIISGENRNKGGKGRMKEVGVEEVRERGKENRVLTNQQILDVDEFLKGEIPNITDIQNLLHISDVVIKSNKKTKKRHGKTPVKETSSCSSSEKLAESESESEDERTPVKKRTR